MNKMLNYIMGIVITISLFTASSFISTIVNLSLTYGTGYDSYQAFTHNSMFGLLIVCVFSLVNHILMAWLTVKLLFIYAKRHKCVKPCFFRVAAFSVIAYACILVPILFSTKAGWITYTSHFLGILLIGKQYWFRYSSTNVETNKYKYCPLCGNQITEKSNYCSRCGRALHK